MNTYFFAAAILCFLLGIVHSVFGELLIFKRMRKTGIVPADGKPVLRSRHVRILWASWHMASIMGWAFGLIILEYAYWPPSAPEYFLDIIAAGFTLSALMVLYGTKGRHPGWVVLFVIAGLCFLG